MAEYSFKLFAYMAFGSFLVLILPLIFTVTLVILFFTSYWPLPIIYITWAYFIDKNTPYVGGRRSEFVRNLSLWTRVREYFNGKLIKTADLDPKKNYIIGSHPHGVFCCSTFVNLFTNGTDFNAQFPGMKVTLMILDVAFQVPLLREIMLGLGACAVSKESIFHVCSTKSGGEVVVIVIGGAKESLDAHPESTFIQLKHRKGFIKLALMTGADLVPAFSFRENETYLQMKNPPGSLVRRFQEKFQSIFTFSPLIFHGLWYTCIPYSVPLTTVVGAPIAVPLIQDPDGEDIDKYHQLYIESLQELYDEHKASYAIDKDKKLIIC